MAVEMPARRLGRSGLVASRLVLGAMNFGARTDEAESLRIIAAAADAGVNFLDTADTYAGGRSEADRRGRDLRQPQFLDRRHQGRQPQRSWQQ